MALVATSVLPESLLALKDLLVCPGCRADLAFEDGSLHCTGCGESYPIQEGIPELAIFGEARNFALRSDVGESYQRKYTDEEASAGYDRQFTEVRHKQTRTTRELDILGRLLSDAGGVDRLLNIPCGGGRLSEPLAQAASLLVEADVSFTQAGFARTHGRYDGADHAAFVTASAFHAPFADQSFDGIVCARLIHHFSATQDHERLLDELSRIARRFIIVSFNDALSLKAASRALRGKDNPMTLAVGELERIAGSCGFQMNSLLGVSPLGSRHRYALLVRNG